MAHLHLLDSLQSRTEHLVGERLRSAALVMGHLRPLVTEAHAHGHSRAAIHARLVAAGLQISWRNYHACLARSRRRAAASGPTDTAARPPVPIQALPAAQPAEARPASVASPTQVRDALRGAQQVGARDYAQVALNLHRKRPAP